MPSIVGNKEMTIETCIVKSYHPPVCTVYVQRMLPCSVDGYSHSSTAIWSV